MIDGQRESEQSWLELLLDAKSRGLTESPRLATGDGALGFWKALKQVYPGTQPQRCWVHKTVNVLDKLPHGQQVSGKEMLHEIWMAATKEEALKAMGKFAATHQAKFPKAVECVLKDQEELLAFYDFPAEHWRIFAPATRSRARSRPCDCEPTKPKAPAREWPAWQWPSNSSSQHKIIGES